MTKRSSSVARVLLLAGALLASGGCSSVDHTGAAGGDAPLLDAGHDPQIDAGRDAGHDAGSVACEAPGTTAPKDVFCIGLYEDRDPTRIAASALPYTPGVTFWTYRLRRLLCDRRSSLHRAVVVV